MQSTGPAFIRPVARPRWLLLAVGGLALCGAGLTISAPERRDPRPPREVEVGETLTLRIEQEDPGCYYESRFNTGPLADHHVRGETLVWLNPFSFMDGCRWVATETLQPAPGGYRYSYRESPVACAPDRTPAAACQRSGFVRATPLR